jgi:hypothetical protein
MSARRTGVEQDPPILDEIAATELELDDEELVRLDDALEASWASARRGTIDADDLLAEIARLEPACG